MSYQIVTICGSMRYYDEMIVAAQEMSKRGFIVLTPFVAFKPDEQESSVIKEMLDDMHLVKILKSDAILVVGEHRGVSTKREMNFAEQYGKQLLEWKYIK